MPIRRPVLAPLVALASLVGLTVVWFRPAPAADAAIVQPTKIAVIVEENATFEQITGAGPGQDCAPGATITPFICGALVGNDLGYDAVSLTNSHEGVITTCRGSAASPAGTNDNIGCVGSTNGTGPDAASAGNYAMMTSGDNCNGVAVDRWGNRGWLPLRTGSCEDNGGSGTRFAVGTDVMAQLDAAHVDWRTYAEGFGTAVVPPSNGVEGVGCNTSVLTWNKNVGYIRRHVPTAFWDDVAHDCVIAPTGGPAPDSKVQDLPNLPGTAGAGRTQAQAKAMIAGRIEPTVNQESSDGTATGAFPFRDVALPSLSFIIPSGCHDMHTAGDGGPCQPAGPGGPGDAWGADARGVPITDKHAAGDYWLSRNLPDILRDLGPTGVAVITFDEDGGGGAGRMTQGLIPTFIVPGQDAHGVPARLACEAAQPCAGAWHDQASITRMIVDAFALTDPLGGSGCDLLDVFGRSNCNGATAMPVALAGG